MDDLRTRAQLVSFDSVGAADAISMVLARGEFAEAADGDEFPATLLLDLDRVESANGEVTAHASVAVDWDKDTLDQLLASTEDEQVALWLDGRELARAFDDDVEGHGLRQKAAVLALTVAVGGASASPALARFAADTDGGGGAAGFVASQASRQAQPMGAQRGLQMDEQISAGQSRVTGTGGSSVDTSSAAELAGAVAGAALLISAAGFGVARKRARPVQVA
jgi:hypothetical protein